jgi:hypothetical protein
VCNPADRDRGTPSNVITVPGMVIADSDIVIADSGIMIADSGVIAWTGRPTYR